MAVRRFQDWPLRGKIVALLVAASTLPVAASSAVVLWRARQVVEHDAVELLEARAEQLAAEFDAFHQSYLVTASKIARYPSVRRFCSDPATQGHESRHLAELLQLAPEEDPRIRRVAVLTPPGRVAVATADAVVGTDLSFRGHVREALAGRAAASELLVGIAGRAEAPVIAYAAPVEGDGTRCAVVVTVRAEAFWDAVRSATGRAGAGSHVAVVDAHGVVIAHGAREDYLFRPVAPVAPDEAARMVSERRFGERTRALLGRPLPADDPLVRAQEAAPHGVGSARVAGSSGDVLVVARRLRTAPWTLVFLAPHAAVLAPAGGLVQGSLLASAALVALALALGLAFAARILAPLRALTTAVGRVAAGDSGARVDVRGGDELALLGRGFNDMAAAIDAGRTNLEAKVRERTLELERVNRELAEATRLKSAFLANMSHELRTPLNSIIGFSDLVLDEGAALTKEQRKYLEDVRASGRHLLQLINDILDLSKIEAGRVELRLSGISAESSLLEACGLVEPAARRKRMAIRPGQVTACPIRADPGKLRQVLLNLLSNAVKFSPEGSVVEVGAEEAGEFVRFTVRDQGTGVPPEVLPRLFQPVAQADTPLARPGHGTGLGLAICKRIVELHGGDIGVETGPAGSSFSFTIPVAAELSQPAFPPMTPPPRRPGARPTTGPPVLVVDDNQLNRELARALLERMGHPVLLARDGDEAIEIARRERPALVLLDVVMPGGKDGYDTARALRADPATARIPIVALTALAMDGDVERAYASGMDAFLTKPIERGALEGAVSRMLSRGAR